MKKMFLLIICSLLVGCSKPRTSTTLATKIPSTVVITQPTTTSDWSEFDRLIAELNQKSTTTTSNTQPITQPASQPTMQPTTQPTTQPTSQPKEQTQEKYNTNNIVSSEYRNALLAAETYSELMHMSKKGIYDQLISEYGEKFSPDAAKYAIENLQTDFKRNALETAKTYQESMNMSKNSIYDQLISEYGEKFTEEEAQYAIEHLD